MIETLGPNAQGFSFALEEFEGRLQLRALHRPDYGPIYADWLSNEMKRRIAGGRKQLLARAVGLNKTRDLRVLDATAGLGRDGFTLAALGAQVTMTERQPMILALLKDAYARAARDAFGQETARRVQILSSDAAQVFARGQWDVIYLDPMYPGRGKSALPQKEMQIFRDLTGGDPDAEAITTAAIHSAEKRVVVKRPEKAAWPGRLIPSFTVTGSQTRFDVYLNATHQSAGEGP